MREHLTDRMLQIAPAIVARLQSAYRFDCHRYDELLSDAYLALLRAYDNFDVTKSPEGVNGLSAFIFMCVERKVLQAATRVTDREYRRMTALSLEALLEESGWEPGDHRGGTQVEVIEAVGRCLKSLRPLDRAVVEMHVMDGMTAKEVGARVGRGRSYVLKRVQESLKRLKRLYLTQFAADVSRNRIASRGRFARWARDNPDAVKDSVARRQEARARASREEAAARRQAGEVVVRCYYLADHDRRVVIGPSGQSARETYRELGQAPPNARSLLLWALSLGPATAGELAARVPQVTENTLLCTLPKLRRGGLAESGKEWRPVWSLTEKGKREVLPVCLYPPVSGARARELKELGYDVMMPGAYLKKFGQ